MKLVSITLIEKNLDLQTENERGNTVTILSNADLLKRVPLFALLTESQAQQMAEAVVKRRFKRGEHIVEQGLKSNALHIILSGRARVLASDSRGREVILATLQSGDYIGEMSLIDNEPHSATVRAEVQTDVLMLGRSEFARCMPDSNSMAYAVMRVLVQRLRHSVRNIESLALMDVYGRLARVLLENAQRDTNGSLVIHDKISRLDLSKMVGASREMVTRVMKDLEQRGFVTVQLDGSMVIKEHLDTLV